MPSQPDNNPPEGEQRSGLQPAELPAAPQTDRPAKTFWKTFLKKMGITARLAGKELQRLKIRQIDLGKADLRLGQKAYATGAAEGEAELVSRLDRVAERLKQLRQQERQAGSTFGEKAKTFASKVAKTVQIAALQRKRWRMMRQLGANLRQSAPNSSLAEETQVARGVADRVSSVETEISQLAPQTYPWARRPLLLVCLLLLLAAIGGAFALRHKPTPALAQQRKVAGGSSLSDEQFKKLESQAQAFREQLLRQQAEMSRQEAEATQARIAAAEREYKEKSERKRGEREKKERERAQAEQLAQRERVEREKQQERAAAAALARQQKEQEKVERLAREKERQEAAALEEQKKKQAAASTPQPPPSSAVTKPSDNAVGLATLLAGAVAGLESKGPAAQSSDGSSKFKSLSTVETPAAAKLREAAEKFAVGRYAEAFKLYGEAISIDPDNPKGYLARGWAFFSTSQRDAALKDFDEAIRRSPKESEAYFRRGVVHASASEHAKAVADFTKAIECCPDYAEAYFERGVAQLANKQPNKAREDFDNVIRLDPKNVPAYLNRGRALIELHETEKALSDFNHAIELSNHEPAVFEGRGLAYLESGKYEAAQKDLEKALSLDHEYAGAYFGLAEVFSAQKNEALAALDLGRAYFYSQQYAKATSEFTRAAKLQPNLPAAHFELGRSKSAEAILEISAATAMDKNPDKDTRRDEKVDAVVKDILARLASPAVKSLEEAARLNSKDANTYLELGKAYFYWQQCNWHHRAAITAFEKAVELEPKSAEAHFWLGVTKYTWGDDREEWKEFYPIEKFWAQLALKDLNTAIELDPQHAGAYYFRANVHRRFERYQNAIDDLTAAIARALPSQRYLEYGAILCSRSKRARRFVTDVPDELLAVSLTAAAYAQRAQCHSEEHAEGAAMGDLDKAIRILPTSPKLFHLRARFQLEHSDAELADLRRAAQLAPGDKYYSNMVQNALKDQARSKELSFWEKAAFAMGAAIVVGAGVEMLSGDSNNSATRGGNDSSGPTRTGRTCPRCLGDRYITVTKYRSSSAPPYYNVPYTAKEVCPMCGGKGTVDY